MPLVGETRKKQVKHTRENKAKRAHLFLLKVTEQQSGTDEDPASGGHHLTLPFKLIH